MIRKLRTPWRRMQVWWNQNADLMTFWCVVMTMGIALVLIFMGAALGKL